jgi:chemotaxis-related protein WspD
LLILAAQGGNVVTPVDEVHGIHAFPEQQLLDASSPSSNANAASGKYTRGVLQWENRSVRLLDEDHLLNAVMRSLT